MKTNTKVAQPLNVLSSHSGKGDDVNLSKRSKLQIITGIAGVLCAAQLFVACQPNGGGRSNPSAIDGKSTSQISPPILGGAGTGDSTGGNGMNNRVFEAYSVDITQTPEWKEHIAPIEAHFETLTDEKGFNGKKLFTMLAKLKTWYIAPVTLDEIEKANLGVEFIKDPIQQLALQTDKAVWIDEATYNAPNTKSFDRAHLQMHETMVGLYLMRFKTATELCILTSSSTADCENPLIAAIIGPPEETRKLTSNDYERIRSMTAWMMQNAKNVKNSLEIRNELYRKGFDPRLFKPRAADSVLGSQQEQKEVQFDWAARPKALVNAKVLGRFPKNCNVKVTGVVAAEACDVNFDLQQSAAEQILTMNFSLLVNDKVQYFTLTQISGLASSPTKRYSDLRPLKQNDRSGFRDPFGIAVPANNGPLQIGQDVYGVVIYWDETGTSVKDIVLSNLRVTKISPTNTSFYSSTKIIGEDFEFGAPNPSEAKNFVITSDTPDASELNRVDSFGGMSTAIRSFEILKK